MKIMKIAGQNQYIQETNQEAFMKGGDFLGAGEFTAKVANVEFNDKRKQILHNYFENNEGKQYKHNQFVPPFQQDYQKNNISSYFSRFRIKLNLPDLTFDTDQLINKIGTIVLKNKFNEEQGKYFCKTSRM